MLCHSLTLRACAFIVRLINFLYWTAESHLWDMWDSDGKQIKLKLFTTGAFEDLHLVVCLFCSHSWQTFCYQEP